MPLTAALYRMGFHSRATAHGFRAAASTILNEQGWRPGIIERKLAHAERNKVRAAYHHSEYLAERKKMMQHWADHPCRHPVWSYDFIMDRTREGSAFRMLTVVDEYS